MKNRLVMTGTLGTVKPDQIKAFEEEFLRKLPQGEFEFLNDMPVSDDELIDKINGADVMITTYQKISEKVYAAAAPPLRACIAYGIGYDSCNVPAASKHNVAVANMPDWCQQEVGLHAVTLMLALHRGILPTIRALDEGRWTDRFAIVAPVERFSYMTVGLYGFGSIAREAAKMLRGFGAGLIAHDPYVDEAVMREYGVTPVDFDTLIRSSDYLSLHAPLLPSTAKIIGADVFENMKRSASIVNTSRGGLIDADALCCALKEGRIRSAALDVFVTEPPTGVEAEMCKLPNVLSTPHTGYYSEAAYLELKSKTIDEAIRVMKGERPLNLRNPEIEGKLDWIRK
jgi:D-3-phosphoglycerate dehydrogenase